MSPPQVRPACSGAEVRETALPAPGCGERAARRSSARLQRRSPPSQRPAEEGERREDGKDDHVEREETDREICFLGRSTYGEGETPDTQRDEDVRDVSSRLSTPRSGSTCSWRARTKLLVDLREVRRSLGTRARGERGRKWNFETMPLDGRSKAAGSTSFPAAESAQLSSAQPMCDQSTEGAGSGTLPEIVDCFRHPQRWILR